jgi:hypothetical protein
MGEFPLPEDDLVYAIPLPLQDLILKEIPDLWTTSEAKFEVILASGSGGVFRSKQPQSKTSVHPEFLLATEFPDPTVSSSRLEFRRKFQKDQDDVKRGRTERLETAGAKRVEHLLRAEEEFRAAEHDVRLAYTGWLLTHHPFLKECLQLKRNAPPSVGQSGRFPVLRRQEAWFNEFLRKAGKFCWFPTTETEKQFDDQCQAFLTRWCLESLFDWNLPVPLRLRAPYSPPFAAAGSSPGLTVFLPSFVLKKKTLDLRDLLDLTELENRLGHLKDWTMPSANRVGMTRYRHLVRMFVFGELALKRRYGRKIEAGRYVQKLDQVFTTYLRNDPQGRSASRGKEESLSGDTAAKLRAVLRKTRAGLAS